MKRENNMSEKMTVLSMTTEVTISNEYLTIIPWARISSESIALMGYWLRGHEGVGNDCFS